MIEVKEAIRTPQDLESDLIKVYENNSDIISRMGEEQITSIMTVLLMKKFDKRYSAEEIDKLYSLMNAAYLVAERQSRLLPGDNNNERFEHFRLKE